MPAQVSAMAIGSGTILNDCCMDMSARQFGGKFYQLVDRCTGQESRMLNEIDVIAMKFVGFGGSLAVTQAFATQGQCGVDSSEQNC
jgi:hypothetical protein